MSKAQVTRYSSGSATLQSVKVYSNKILMHLESVFKFEASVWKTP